MIEMPRKKVEELLKQAGFSEIEVDRINLLSICPIPVLAINSHTVAETGKMWGEIFDGKDSPIKEVSTAYYQCLLLGQVIGVKIITMESDLNNPGEWKKESKIEVFVYRKIIYKERWEKFTLICREDRRPDTISNSELDNIRKVAKFIEFAVEEYNRNCQSVVFSRS